jgi:hypothetical protein
MASAELSRRVEKVVGYRRCEMDDLQLREFRRGARSTSKVLAPDGNHMRPAGAGSCAAGPV